MHECIYIQKYETCLYNYRFLDPLMFGNYPSSMKSRVGNRLPTFSPSEAALVKGSLDFVGINHYTTFYARKGSLLDGASADSDAITLRKLILFTSHFTINFCSIFNFQVL